MREALDLIGDGDELLLIKDLEDIFAIKFTDSELAACRTAGDLNAVVWRNVEQRGGADNKRCMSAMAFYAVRGALMACGAAGKIRLSDRLDDFSLKPRVFARAVRQHGGLKIGFCSGPLGKAGALMQLAWLPLLVGVFTARPDLALVSAATVAAGFAAMGLDPRTFGQETVADTAERLAALNFGALVAKGARFDRQSIWRALQHVLADYSNGRTDEIGAETLLIQKR